MKISVKPGTKIKIDDEILTLLSDLLELIIKAKRQLDLYDN